MHQMIIHDETAFDLTPIFPPKTHPKIAFKSQNAKQTVFQIKIVFYQKTSFLHR